MRSHICSAISTLTIALGSSLLAQEWTAPESGWLYVLVVDAPNGGGRVLLVDPSAGIVKGILPTAYHPDFGLSRDGARLYVLDGPQSSGDLSIIDTRTGRLLEKTPFPDRAVYTDRPSLPGIALSTDGRLLFIQKMITARPGVDQHSLVVIDAGTGTVSTQSISLPPCGIAEVVPLPFGSWSLAVECSRTNSLRLVALGTGGEPLRVKDVGLRWASKIRPDGIKADNAQRMTSFVDLDPVDKSLAIFRAYGGVDELDPDTLLAVPKLADNWQHWVRSGAIVRSPDSALFYVGFGQRTTPGGLMGDIGVFATPDWNQLAAVRTTLPFCNLAISPDGRWLYGANPDARSITVIDTKALTEIKTISDLGDEPSLIIVQP